jgi:hypothetical protein
MTLTSAQRVRLKIADTPKRVIVQRYGDGTASTFQVEHTNLVSESAYVPAANGWSATGCTVDTTGLFLFSGRISAASAVQFDYVHTVFSDTEIDQFLTDGGTIIGASVEALGTLMFDAMRCSRWFASDGSSNDNTSSQSHARAMYDILVAELSAEGIDSGGFGSWALNQDGWT